MKNNHSPTTTNTNFCFLAEHNKLFLQLATSAERLFSSDPNATLIKVRQLAEALGQEVASRCGVAFDEQTTQSELIGELYRQAIIDKPTKDTFHQIRLAGNDAVHQFVTTHKDAIEGLRLVRNLCVWFHQNFGKNAQQFKPQKFITPTDPSLELTKVQAQLHELEQRLAHATAEKSDIEQLAKLQAQEKQEYQQLAEMMDEEARHLAEKTKQQEEQLAELEQTFTQHIADLQQQLNEQSQANAATKRPKRKKLSAFLPDEETTRLLIDEQLRQAGWQADSQKMTYAKGECPEKGKNKAIAEWQIDKERADYVLFIGLMPVAVVEAKRQDTDVAGRLSQAERYAQDFDLTAPLYSVKFDNPTPMNRESKFTLPFVFSANGRPFIHQLAEASGIWFKDVRHPSNTARPLQEFYSPEGLKNLLEQDIANAEQQLINEPFGYLNLRDYQIRAIQAIEQRLAMGQREILVAMATGTGKTRTIIGLIYRLLKADRFKRILFLVDRTALGEQAFDSMQEMTLEQSRPLSKIYTITELGDKVVAPETRVQVSTVQAMVQRLFGETDDGSPTIDQYDCIIVDEAHRGYTLDQEMSDDELEHRDAMQYISSYRRVLDYFDAVKIGLTATPAKHTTEIFGRPVFIYSYREAVADGWLIDYEPPIRYHTLLAEKGIHLDKGDTVNVINTLTGTIDTTTLEDEQNFDVAVFNRQVVTEGFNRVICQQLAQEIDPNGKEKTLIFCVTDRHADMVKRLLDEAFSELWGDAYNEQAVRKITGTSDQVDKLIRAFKNETYPSVAITVDLLTTGIDVPSICHIVFLRRVKSRILYEQMKGRATRRCDEIGKTVFKIYDPVDLYATLQKVDTMPPLVKNPNIGLDQLIDEFLTLTDKAETHSVAEPSNDQVSEPAATYRIDSPDSSDSLDNADIPNKPYAEQLLDEINQKLMRVLRKAINKAEKNPDIKAKLAEFETAWGISPAKLHETLHKGGVAFAKEFLQNHPDLINQLVELKFLVGTENMPIIYEGEDKFLKREQVLEDGGYEKLDDYLDSFDNFIREQVNQSVALQVVANHPKDLTRETLKEVKLLLDKYGYSEAKLQSAWRHKTNQDIAASIVAHIRRAALGEALIPLEERVNRAMASIYASHAWTALQKQWLDRLAKQLKLEAVIDRQFVKERFADNGGDKLLDKVLGNHLDSVLEQINENLWTA